MLLEKGVNVNGVNDSGETASHIAVRKQSTKCFDILQRFRANLNIQVGSTNNFSSIFYLFKCSSF